MAAGNWNWGKKQSWDSKDNWGSKEEWPKKHRAEEPVVGEGTSSGSREEGPSSAGMVALAQALGQVIKDSLAPAAPSWSTAVVPSMLPPAAPPPMAPPPGPPGMPILPSSSTFVPPGNWPPCGQLVFGPGIPVDNRLLHYSILKTIILGAMALKPSRLRFCWKCYSTSWFSGGATCSSPGCMLFGFREPLAALEIASQDPDMVSLYNALRDAIVSNLSPGLQNPLNVNCLDMDSYFWPKLNIASPDEEDPDEAKGKGKGQAPPAKAKGPGVAPAGKGKGKGKGPVPKKAAAKAVPKKAGGKGAVKGAAAKHAPKPALVKAPVQAKAAP